MPGRFRSRHSRSLLGLGMHFRTLGDLIHTAFIGMNANTNKLCRFRIRVGKNIPIGRIVASGKHFLDIGRYRTPRFKSR